MAVSIGDYCNFAPILHLNSKQNSWKYFKEQINMARRFMLLKQAQQNFNQPILFGSIWVNFEYDNTISLG